MSEHNSVGKLEGIKNLLIKTSESKQQSNLDGQLACGKRFNLAMQELKHEGWSPDFVISHTGWGCGLDVSWIFPQAKRICYLEWWFNNNSPDYTFDPGNRWWSYNHDKCMKLRHRNLSLALELSEADCIVTPTNWQRSQLPSVFSERCQVIHEGVDTDFFVMNTKFRPKNRIRLTYATRGMEPMRGFPEFVQALPSLLTKYPQLEVVVAGDDRVAYGARVPPEGSFGRWAKCQLEHWINSGAVRFVGQLSLTKYARLLKSSHVHCYLTRPFVVSWSLLDAMASGCCLVASNVETVREVANPTATTWVDHRNQDELIDGLSSAIIMDTEERNSKGLLQRQTATSSWARSNALQMWRGLLGI